MWGQYNEWLQGLNISLNQHNFRVKSKHEQKFYGTWVYMSVVKWALSVCLQKKTHFKPYASVQPQEGDISLDSPNSASFNKESLRLATTSWTKTHHMLKIGFCLFSAHCVWTNCVLMPALSMNVSLSEVNEVMWPTKGIHILETLRLADAGAVFVDCHLKKKTT